jgi:hypothetical protein
VDDEFFGWGLARLREHEAASREDAAQARTWLGSKPDVNRVVLARQAHAAAARLRANGIARMQLRAGRRSVIRCY